MQKEYQIQGSQLIVMLPAEVDHPAADRIRRETDSILNRNRIRTIVFNFENTIFMDSSGIGMIMGRYKALGMRDGCIQVMGASERICRILHLSGLSKILNSMKQEKFSEKKGENGPWKIPMSSL